MQKRAKRHQKEESNKHKAGCSTPNINYSTHLNSQARELISTSYSAQNVRYSPPLPYFRSVVAPFLYDAARLLGNPSRHMDVVALFHLLQHPQMWIIKFKPKMS